PRSLLQQHRCLLDESADSLRSGGRRRRNFRQSLSRRAPLGSSRRSQGLVQTSRRRNAQLHPLPLLNSPAMKTTLLRLALLFTLAASAVAAQQTVIPLYDGVPPGSTPADYPEKSYYSTLWKTQVVTNVTKPSLTVFAPAPETKNGTAIVICPGGGFM